MNAETALNKKVTKATGEKRMLVKNVGGGGPAKDATQR